MENLEQDFRKCYKKIKTEAIVASIIYAVAIFLSVKLQWPNASVSPWIAGIFIVVIVLKWTRAWVVKRRINKKWFATNEREAREFMNNEKEGNAFTVFVLWLGFMGACIIIFGYFEHSMVWIIVGILMNFSAQAIALAKLAYQAKRKKAV